MLLSRRGDVINALDTVHNYYEHLVIEQIHKAVSGSSHNQDYLADVACVALNQLPPRYIRHDVDMAFYLPSTERQEIHNQVTKAVEEAIQFVDSSKQRYDKAEQ